DVYGALQSLPGTTVNGESGRLFVKGGDSEESQTYIDGSLVSVPYNSSAPNLATRGRFNPFMFKGTIFSTGGYSAEYGQALSSVLLLSTNDMSAEDQLDLSFLSVGVEVAGTKK
ncbi:MAG: TonB-dependent receptor, partial [Bacteroidota bacterium]|nr:TonB-dependent receptor [Bacteroidota bacterium]